MNIESVSVDIYSAAGIIFVMVLHQVPFVYLTIRGPIMGMDPSYEEAARTAGASPWRMLRSVTLPMLSYALASSALLCLVLTLEQFGIPVLIGVPGHVTVLATQIYLLCRFPPTAYGLAAAIGLTLAAITGIAILLQRRLARGGRSVVTTGKAGKITPIPLGAWRWPVNLICGLYIAVSLVLPGLILLYTSLIKFFTANPFDAAFTFRNYVYIWNSEETQRAIVNTMIVSGGGALVGVLLGVACSYFTRAAAPDRLSRARCAGDAAVRRARHRARSRPVVGLRLSAAAALRHADLDRAGLRHALPALCDGNIRRAVRAARSQPRGGGVDRGREPACPASGAS